MKSSDAPFWKEVDDALHTIASAMGFYVVDDADYLFFAVKSKDRYTSIPMSCMYGKNGVPSPSSPYRNLLEDCMSRRKTFGESIANPFYGCKSIEEVYIRADLLRAGRCGEPKKDKRRRRAESYERRC